jgi:purine-binding chemotaxis protein CheW
VSESSELSGPGWETLARRAAATSSRRVDPDMRVELLACELAGSPYAIAVDRVREIVRLRPLTPVPRTPEWLLGVIALRGEVVQVIDLRMCLGLPRAEFGRRTRIVVLHGEDDEISGVLVDCVRSVLRLDADSIRPSSMIDVGAVREMCCNGDEFVSIIDLDRVLERHAGG